MLPDARLLPKALQRFLQIVPWLLPFLTPELNAAGPTPIAPSLLQRCADCHGPAKAESGLRMDSREFLLKGGDHGPAIVPGNAQASLLLQVLAGTHAEIQAMPKKGPRLSPAELQTVSAWIQNGAPWPTNASTTPEPKNHWAFIKPSLHTSPKARNRNHNANLIDTFTRSQLKQQHLDASPEADRPTLIRRLSLDLTGLPPSIPEIDAFIADRHPDAYHRLVERLLASPHHGEHWARHWLDAARYADSNGFEKDRTRTIWPYRDWVIQAINQDLPFDQFTIEQLAGDLLPNPTLQQRVATGFLRNSMLNQEGGVEPEKFRTESMLDRVETVSRTWLGLTINCCQCHSHKYDPISQREYYQFYAFLNNDDEPTLEVPTPAQLATRAEIQSKVNALDDTLQTPETLHRMQAWEDRLRAPQPVWTPINPSEWHSQPMKFEKQEDLSLLAGGDVASETVLRLWWDSPLPDITGFRIEAMTDANLPFNGPGLVGDGTFNLAEFTVDTTPLSQLQPGLTNNATTNHVLFSRANASSEARGWEASQAINSITTNSGWANAFTIETRNQPHQLVVQTSTPTGHTNGLRYLITLHSKAQNTGLSCQTIGRVRISVTTQTGPLDADPLTPEQRRILNLPANRRSTNEHRTLFQAFRRQDPDSAGTQQKIEALWKGWPAAATTTLALQARPTPRHTRIFKRGDWLKPTDEVQPNTPAILHPFPPDAPRNRLGLARWLVDPTNPITARVIVNRVWQSYFGQGLVTTPEDFGTRADPPSHPELLDALALEFTEPRLTLPGESHPTPWSLKHLHRLITHSATYRQDSRTTPTLLEKDPYNRQLARGARFRVEAETIQDIALQAAGILSPKIGGPSVFPTLPDGVMQISYGPIPWNVSEGEDRYRRGLYTFWKRSVPYPALMSFDAPASEQSCARRTRSNTPLQALTTLNEPTFNTAAKWLAFRTLHEGGNTDASRIRHAFRLCTARVPDAQETQSLMRLLQQAQAEFDRNPTQAAQAAFPDPKNPAPLPIGTTLPQLAAWSAVARTLLNLDETLTRP